MAQKIIAVEDVLQNLAVDKVGAAGLEGWKGTPLWDMAQRLLPGAASVLVLALEVFPEIVEHLTPESRVGDMALRDLYLANDEFIAGRLNVEAYRIVKALHGRGFKGLNLPARGGPVDRRFLGGALSYKHAAQAAGLGSIGWHSLLITPEYGPRVRLACVLTNAPLSTSASPSQEAPCTKCGGVCIRVCPAGAIGEPQEGETYHLDKYACSAFHTSSGVCGQCLKFCPPGRKS